MFQVLTCSVAIILITWLAKVNYNVKKLTVPVPEITRNLAYDIGGRYKAIPKLFIKIISTVLTHGT